MSVATSTAIALGGIAAAGGSVASGIMQSKSANKATDAQTAANQAALDFAKQRYAQSQANQAPYMAAGTAATSGISNLLAAAAKKQGYGYTPPPNPATAGAPMVSLKAPDGSVRQVPQDQAQQYIQRGATPVTQ